MEVGRVTLYEDKIHFVVELDADDKVGPIVADEDTEDTVELGVWTGSGRVDVMELLLVASEYE